MNRRLPALSTGVAWARCGRPSTLSRRTTSTFGSNSSMLPTNSTPYLSWIVLAKPSTRLALVGRSGLPALNAAVTLIFHSGCDRNNSVKAGTWEVSVPMMPARRSLVAHDRARGQGNFFARPLVAPFVPPLSSARPRPERRCAHPRTSAGP